MIEAAKQYIFNKRQKDRKIDIGARSGCKGAQLSFYRLMEDLEKKLGKGNVVIQRG